MAVSTRDIVQRQGTLIEASLNSDASAPVKTASEFVDTLTNYPQWIVNRYINREFVYSDLICVNEYLLAYKEIRSQLNPDIMSYTWSKLVLAIDSAPKSNRQQDKEYKQHLIDSAQIIVRYRDDETVAYEPTTYEASVVLSRGTQWCTGGTSELGRLRFEEYTTGLFAGSLIIVIQQGRKFIFHFGILEFSNEADEKLTTKTIRDLRQFPGIDHVFVTQEQALLAQANCQRIFEYTNTVLEKPWPAAEEIISQDPYYALLYAVRILKNRWPLGEPAINSVERYATAYQRFISVTLDNLGQCSVLQENAVTQ
jgi:hypothetical protein